MLLKSLPCSLYTSPLSAQALQSRWMNECTRDGPFRFLHCHLQWPTVIRLFCLTLRQSYTSNEMQDFVYGGVIIVTWFHKKTGPSWKVDRTYLTYLMLQRLLVTWTVVNLTTAKCKPLIFSVSGFALPYTENMFILMLLYDFCLLSVHICYIIVYILKAESCVQIADRCAPWKISNGAENFVCRRCNFKEYLWAQSSPTILLITSRHGQHRKYNSSVALYGPLPSNGHCLVGCFAICA
jgi:hypothetical protein